MNVENINKLAEALEEVEQRGDQLFDMGDWGTNMWHNVLGSMGIRLKKSYDEDGEPEEDYGGVEIQGITLDDKINHCGTSGCIAGWAILVLGDDFPRISGSSDYAANLLGLEDPAVASSLFTPSDNELPADMMYSDITASMSAMILRNLAKTGAVEWHMVDWIDPSQDEADEE